MKMNIFICASIFGDMSLYGYTTKTDLKSMGSFFIMGLIGIIVVSLANIFFRSPAVDFATPFIGVAAFMGLHVFGYPKIENHLL
jgi:FtsH-binding integral membrane protein